MHSIAFSKNSQGVLQVADFVMKKKVVRGVDFFIRKG
jgi:hypothetical protein